MDDPDTTTGLLVHYVMRDAAAMIGVPGVVAVSPDAELLQACAAFDALERASLATFRQQEPGSAEETAAEAEREQLSEAQEPLVDRMCERQAVTRDGQAARARSLALWNAELMKPKSRIHRGPAHAGDRAGSAFRECGGLTQDTA